MYMCACVCEYEYLHVAICPHRSYHLNVPLSDLKSFHKRLVALLD